MPQVNEQLVRDMVQKVLQHVQSGWGGRVPPTVGKNASPIVSAGQTSQSSAGMAAQTCQRFGQFGSVAEAVEAARVAQRAIVHRSLAQREIACDLIRQICINQADMLGRMEMEETKIGHAAHKVEKLSIAANCANGTKALRTECFSGDHGITLEERGPWGVIGIITPVTHSLPTLAVNAVNMIAAGNAVVCNPHPGGKKIAAHGAKLFNQAIYEKLGIDNLICVITEPTIESADQIFKHPDVDLIVVTGGPAVVAAALKSGKRAICAGPGNPPVVVDDSADMDNAARCIVEGSSYDNNLLCLSEKEAFVVDSVFDRMMDAMAKAGAYRLTTQQMEELTRICINLPKDPSHHPTANKKFIGAEPQTIGAAIGLTIPASCRLLFGEVSSNMHPFVQAEQMMPVLPFVRCRDFEQAVEFAKQAEHGFRHTAVIHSKLVDHMTYMGKEMNTTLYIKNGPSTAGNGGGGEGYGNFSIACSTGEGIATPNTYTRFRRCTMVDNLRIV
ncbi:MAG: aldehyde dehydrogenase [Planctomycetes bacterium]|nr:aldehyde dehydrogenase [Planctomycetota bacterium]